jgi:hypothetical protein
MHSEPLIARTRGWSPTVGSVPAGNRALSALLAILIAVPIVASTIDFDSRWRFFVDPQEPGNFPSAPG